MSMVWSHRGKVDVVIPTGCLILYSNKTMIMSFTILKVWCHFVGSIMPDQLIL